MLARPDYRLLLLLLLPLPLHVRPHKIININFLLVRRTASVCRGGGGREDREIEREGAGSGQRLQAAQFWVLKLIKPSAVFGHKIDSLWLEKLKNGCCCLLRSIHVQRPAPPHSLLSLCLSTSIGIIDKSINSTWL